jgi:SsrA-binding protein
MTEVLRTIVTNRKARHLYSIEDTIEAGIMLVGSEVKSLREGKASIAESFAGEFEGGLYLLHATIPEYRGANRFNHVPNRPRKLLVKRREMDKLLGKVKAKGMTLVPLSLYFNAQNRVKVELGLAKGKNVVDRRETVKERDWQREKNRVLKLGKN